MPNKRKSVAKEWGKLMNFREDRMEKLPAED
jgi:hypothetical protein